jgi:hypothetical protein
MKIKEVSATWGVKYNLGDYNSVGISITLTGEVEDGDTEDGAIDKMMMLAKTHVRQEIKEVLDKRKAAVQEMFAGLPVDVQAKMK